MMKAGWNGTVIAESSKTELPARVPKVRDDPWQIPEVQDQRSAAKPDRDAEKLQSERNAQYGGEPGGAATAGAMFGPGVISMRREVRTKATSGD